MAYPPHGLTADQLAEYAPFDPETPNVAKAIDAAVGQLRDRAGWHVFPSVTETLNLDGEGGEVLTLPTLKVSAVLEVRENGLVLDPSAYEWSAKGDLRRRGWVWTSRWNGITVQLTHGYENPPAELLRAIGTAVATAAANPLGIPEVMGPFQFTGSGGTSWIGDSAETMNRYVLPWSA